MVNIEDPVMSCGIFYRWRFQISFYLKAYLGKWSNLTNIFQMAWNHQLVNLSTIAWGWDGVLQFKAEILVFEKEISPIKKADGKMEDDAFFFGLSEMKRRNLDLGMSRKEVWI